MAQNKIPLKDVLAAIDMNGKSIWNELDEEERKSINFWLLNRYVSNVHGNFEKQAMAIFKTNEYYNKNYNELQKNHKQLLWQLLCASGATGKIESHPWMGLKSKKGSTKPIKLLEKIYPNMKSDEVELLAKLHTTKELRKLAEDHGIEKPDI